MMTTWRPLLLAGNKRSGTSLLGRLLNEHPAIFVAHETDLVTALQQLSRRERFHDDYPWDAPLSLSALVSQYGFELPHVTGAHVRQLFYDALRLIMAHGASGQPPRPDKIGRDLQWIGDKKPVQYADPAIRAFLREYFPDTRFLHIVRHPRACVASMKAAAEDWGPQYAPAYWRQPVEFVLERWTIHEEWMLDARDDGWPVHTLRHEDLCRDPQGVMRDVFEFLEVDGYEPAAWAQIRPSAGDRYTSFDIAPTARTLRVMARYGYSPDGA